MQLIPSDLTPDESLSVIRMNKERSVQSCAPCRRLLIEAILTGRKAASSQYDACACGLKPIRRANTESSPGILRIENDMPSKRFSALAWSIACAALLASSTAAFSHDNPLVVWANATHERALGPTVADKVRPFLMAREDRFTSNPARAMPRIATPCSGSRWVYDYKNHIAFGDDGGDMMLLYAADPPTRISHQDLTGVTTKYGLRLGDTPDQVTRALRVPTSDVVRFSTNEQFLYLQKDVWLHNDPGEYYDIATVIFNDGRAVAIYFAHDEN